MELPQGQTGSVGTSVASAEQVNVWFNWNQCDRRIDVHVAQIFCRVAFPILREWKEDSSFLSSCLCRGGFREPHLNLWEAPSIPHYLKVLFHLVHSKSWYIKKTQQLNKKIHKTLWTNKPQKTPHKTNTNKKTTKKPHQKNPKPNETVSTCCFLKLLPRCPLLEVTQLYRPRLSS